MIIPSLIWYGIISGTVIAIGAVGLSLIYGVLHFPNFAHADLILFTAYMCYLSSEIINPDIFLSFIIALCVSIALNYVLQKVILTPGSGTFSLTILSFGVSFCLRESIRLLTGGDIKKFPVSPGAPILLGEVKVTPNQLIVVTIGIISLFFMHIFLKYTKIGKALRAISDNPELAEVTGIKVKDMATKLWILVSISIAITGLCVGMEYGYLLPDIGLTLAVPLWAACVVGGIGNPYGALVGGLLIGVSMEMSTLFVSPRYKIFVAFIALMIFLFVKPEGIMGVRKRY